MRTTLPHDATPVHGVSGIGSLAHSSAARGRLAALVGCPTPTLAPPLALGWIRHLGSKRQTWTITPGQALVFVRLVSQGRVPWSAVRSLPGGHGKKTPARSGFHELPPC